MTVNNFVNQNHQDILRELKEPLGESLSEVFHEILNNAFRHIPTDMWLIDEDLEEKRKEKKEDDKKERKETAKKEITKS